MRHNLVTAFLRIVEVSGFKTDVVRQGIALVARRLAGSDHGLVGIGSKSRAALFIRKPTEIFLIRAATADETG